MKTKLTKLLAVVLTLCMVFSIIPLSALSSLAYIPGYTVKFDTGSGEAIPDLVNVRKLPNPLPTPVYEGCDFLGWFTDPMLTVDAVAGAKISEDTTLYASWKVKTFDVIFCIGGTRYAKRVVDYGKTVTAPEAPQKEGYHLGKWCTDIKLENEFDFATPVKNEFSLYADYEINEYTVNFKNTEVAPATVKHGQTVKEPTTPEKEGCTFKGWFADSEFKAPFDFKTVITADTDVFGKWETDKFTVTFSTFGGTELEDVVVDYGETVKAPENVEKEHYVLEGWFTEDTFENEYKFDTPVTKDIDLFAKWKLETNEVQFVTDGGTEIEPQTVDYGSKATKPSKDPEKEGYIFDGWYADEDFKTEFDFSKEITEDTKVYAKWLEGFIVTVEFGGKELEIRGVKAENTVAELKGLIKKKTDIAVDCQKLTFNGKTLDDKKKLSECQIGSDATVTLTELYIVTFNANGGTCDTQKAYAEANGKLNPLPTAAKAHCVFKGWFIDDVEFTVNTVVTKDITVKAKWETDKFTVTFENSDIPDQTVEYGAKVNKPIEPAKEGYTFGGYFKDKELTVNFNFDASITEDTSVYVKWTVNTYDVTFETSGGSTVAKQTVNHGELASCPANDPTKAGYVFDGWYTSDKFTAKFDFMAPIKAKVTVYAKWVAEVYTVEFLDNDGVVYSTAKVENGKTVTKPANPAKTGYTFDNWYTSGTFATAFNFAAPITGNTKVYAKFTVKTFTVSFVFGRKESGDYNIWKTAFVNYGEKALEPAPEFIDGLDFVGFFANEECTVPFDFNAAIYEDTYVFSSYKKHIDGAFADVNEEDWFFDAVYYGVDKGIFDKPEGNIQTDFGPNNAIQRQDFMLVLARAMKVDLSAYADVSLSFTDVVKDSYYYNAIAWGYTEGIITGYENGAFGVGDGITREQTATILCRYAKKIGAYTAPEKSAEEILSKYTDADKVSEWAKESLAWCIDNHIIHGMDETYVAPLYDTTRAQVAQMYMNATT